jgi:hypothetical protein
MNREWRRWWVLAGLASAVLSPAWAMEEHASALNKLKEQHLGSEPTVRILVARDAQNLLLEVQGKYRVYDPGSGEYLSNGAGKKFMVRAQEDGLQWGEEYPGHYQFQIVPRSASTTIFLNGIQYQGALAIYQVEGKMFAVNEVKVEDYLHSVLPAYLEGGPRGEALAAAAIVARTDLMAQTSSRPNAIWHLDGRKIGYLGFACSYQDPELDKAVQTTRGLVMVAGEAGHPFRCCWEDLPSAPLSARNLFDGHRTDAVAGSPKARTQWSCSLPKAELAKLANVQAIKAVASRAEAGGRVTGLSVSDGAKQVEVTMPVLQKQLGTRRLRSQQFHVQLAGEHVRFSGQSDGGGMDLMAAQDMAERGKDAAAVLRTFFPNARLQPWGE